MPRRRLFWHLYPLYLVVTIATFLSAGLLAARALRTFYYQHVEADLTTRARLAEELVAERLTRDSPEQLQAYCVDLGKRTSLRLTIIQPDGHVLADSLHDPKTMVNHADRPEIRDALASGTGKALRFSETVHDYLMYIALAVKDGGRVTAVIRTSMSLTSIDEALRAMQVRMAATAALLGLLMFVVILSMHRRITRPLEELRTAAIRFAGGDLGFRIPEHGSDELGDLVRTLNQMASMLSERIDTIVQQRNEQRAMLASMVEGVVAIDASENILHINRAAADLIGVPGDTAKGRTVREMIRNPELQRLTTRVLTTGDTAEDEVVFYGSRERSIQVHVTALRDAADQRIGALIVLYDVTNLRRLERVRQDFVANVSHELKTPLTSIKGFVETLREGAIDQPAEARRFLGIMDKQVDRLHAILEDLLALSRVERESERGQVDLEDGSIEDVLRSAVQICSPQAVAKKIEIAIDCPGGPRARINAALLEQAAVNLIDNAIKYSDDGKPLRIEVRKDAAQWAIQFIDQGCGIEAQHLDRIFERFYRVDKARSRKEGGTGLGLSIVKHIVLAHGGRVHVVSTPGKGSVFTVWLPAAP